MPPNNSEDKNDTRRKCPDLVQLPKFNLLKALVVIVDHKNKGMAVLPPSLQKAC